MSPRTDRDGVLDDTPRSDGDARREMAMAAHQRVVPDGDRRDDEHTRARLIGADQVRILADQAPQADAHVMGLAYDRPRREPGSRCEARAERTQGEQLEEATGEAQRLEEREIQRRSPRLQGPAHAAAISRETERARLAVGQDAVQRRHAEQRRPRREHRPYDETRNDAKQRHRDQRQRDPRGKPRPSDPPEQIEDQHRFTSTTA